MKYLYGWNKLRNYKNFIHYKLYIEESITLPDWINHLKESGVYVQRWAKHITCDIYKWRPCQLKTYINWRPLPDICDLCIIESIDLKLVEFSTLYWRYITGNFIEVNRYMNDKLCGYFNAGLIEELTQINIREFRLIY